MTIQTLIYVWAALTGAVFSTALYADDESKVIENKPSVEWSKMEITRGNNANPHKPPEWFARMTPPEREYPKEIESFVFNLPEVSSYVGRPPRIGRKYACQQPDKSWIFCD